MITIKENGLALYFEVNSKNNLFFYGIKDETEEAPIADEKEMDNFPAVEIRTTGANTSRHLGQKSIAFLCPELPEYISYECVSDKIGKRYIFNLKTSLLEIKLNYLFANSEAAEIIVICRFKTYSRILIHKLQHGLCVLFFVRHDFV